MVPGVPGTLLILFKQRGALVAQALDAVTQTFTGKAVAVLKSTSAVLPDGVTVALLVAVQLYVTPLTNGTE